MRVEPSGAQPSVIRTQPKSSPSDAGPVAAPVDTGTFTPTPDLAKLIAAVRDTPEVRADVIASVAARMAAGQLATPEAAADAARALLGDGLGE